MGLECELLGPVIKTLIALENNCVVISFDIKNIPYNG